jgi:ribulose-5-phosphate 4-epimerase/fuculose-1-phosphate aldolase
MSVANPKASLSVRDQVSKDEWEARVNLAAAYRLVALYGWDDLVFTHISARVPGPEHHFLINPYGWMFEEITASSLVKVDLQARKVMPSSSKRRIEPRCQVGQRSSAELPNYCDCRRLSDVKVFFSNSPTCRSVRR